MRNGPLVVQFGVDNNQRPCYLLYADSAATQRVHQFPTSYQYVRLRLPAGNVLDLRHEGHREFRDALVRFANVSARNFSLRTIEVDHARTLRVHYSANGTTGSSVLSACP